MAETMTALVERHRAYLAAYSAADFGPEPAKGEEAWLATADTKAAELIEGETPRLLDKADLLAAISYLIEDRGFIQQGHRNVLLRVMEYLSEPEAEIRKSSDVASAEFEPWKGKPELMKRDVWLSWLPTLCYCIATMHRTKPELVAMFREIPEAVTDLQDRMATMAEFLSDMEGLAAGASGRLLVAAAVVAAEDAGEVEVGANAG